MTTDFRIEGLNELRQAIRKFPAAAKRGAENGMTKAVIRVQRSARERAPVDTGRLRASIAWRVQAIGAGVQGIIGSRVEYAPYQEFGTKRGIQPKRYLRGAIEANIQDITNDLVSAIREELRKL